MRENSSFWEKWEKECFYSSGKENLCERERLFLGKIYFCLQVRDTLLHCERVSQVHAQRCMQNLHVRHDVGERWKEMWLVLSTDTGLHGCQSWVPLLKSWNGLDTHASTANAPWFVKTEHESWRCSTHRITEGLDSRVLPHLFGMEIVCGTTEK